ncbi:MAG: polyphosphate polymerase domain-containing protein [Clostridia bacterium]|nr:polyphosphate polymerase domain-containing protein [Clostridia bacterium]
MDYRHEIKYVISLGEAELLATRLRLTLSQDPFVDPKTGSYFIRSLYFDTPFETAVDEKASGVEFRDKYRIRIYNFSDKTIKFERKHKNGQFIGKQSLLLTRQQTESILNGEYGFLLHRKEDFAAELYAALRTEGWRPKVLVDYDRVPFVFPLEDVRITLDKNIRTGLRCTDLFNPHAPTFPATDYPNACVLEVKFNRYLPSYVRSLIQVDAASHTAASKYLFCRQFDF